ncbi:MAG TPA: hypothetical protein VFA37_04955 [Gaiellaceae bacterium]|nr:hypothetical protein [Gaiellaceae bacterium]
MRTTIALLIATAALGGTAAAGTSRAVASSRLVPVAVAFSDRLHGELGLATPHCDGCAPRGAIAVTSDGGRTWRIVRHTARRVVALAFYQDGSFRVGFEGAALRSFEGYCPTGWTAGFSADAVDTNIITPWSICVGQPGAGNQAKAVYRGTQRVAYTPPTSHGGYGGIGSYGYPVGIAGTHGGFGIVWETRGTLYVSRNGGRQWLALPKVAQPELDFGQWADVVQGNLGFVLLERNGHSRLIETTDAGHTWRVVHRWR